MTRDIDRLVKMTFPAVGEKDPNFRWDALANEVRLEELRQQAKEMRQSSDIDWARNPGLLLRDDRSERVTLYGPKGPMNTQSQVVVVFNKGVFGLKIGRTTEVTLIDRNYSSLRREARFNAGGERLRPSRKS